ncbi:MAG: hypothetical protein AB1807_16745 [Pseudomonadota bacterium]
MTLHPKQASKSHWLNSALSVHMNFLQKEDLLTDNAWRIKKAEKNPLPYAYQVERRLQARSRE